MDGNHGHAITHGKAHFGCTDRIIKCELGMTEPTATGSSADKEPGTTHNRFLRDERILLLSVTECAASRRSTRHHQCRAKITGCCSMGENETLGGDHD